MADRTADAGVGAKAAPKIETRNVRKVYDTAGRPDDGGRRF